MAWNFGAKMVPITKAVNGNHNPLKWVYKSNKNRTATKIAAKQKRLYNKALVFLLITFIFWLKYTQLSRFDTIGID